MFLSLSICIDFHEVFASMRTFKLVLYQCAESPSGPTLSGVEAPLRLVMEERLSVARLSG